MRTRYKELSLQQLRTFLEICRQGSYSKVARGLRLSTSAVWEQIRGLERHFEMTLLEARDGKVLPTAEGERLLELAAAPLSDLEAIKEVLHQLGGRPPQRITLVSGMRFLCEEATLAVAKFRKRHPEVTVRLWFVADSLIDGLVESGEADCGVRHQSERDRDSYPPVRVEPAYEHDYLLITSPKHPLNTAKRLRLEDIVRYPLVISMHNLPTRRRINAILQRHGLSEPLNVAVETSSSVMTVSAVRGGLGPGIIAGHSKGILTRGLGVRSLERWFGRAQFVFVQRRGVVVPPIQSELIELIRDCGQDD